MGKKEKNMKKILKYKEIEKDWVTGDPQERTAVYETELKEGQTPEDVLRKYAEDQYNYLRGVWQYDDCPCWGDFYASSANYSLEFEIIEVREEPDD